MASFKDLYNNKLKNSYKSCSTGNSSIIEVKVRSVNLEKKIVIVKGVFLKSDGIIKLQEFSDTPNVDDVITVLYDPKNGTVSYNKAIIQQAIEKLILLQESKQPISCLVKSISYEKDGKNIKGYNVELLSCVMGFLPRRNIRSDVDEQIEINKSLQCRILDVKPNRPALLSYIPEGYPIFKLASEVPELKVGNEYEGKIWHVTRYGLYLEVLGVEVFVRTEEISWNRVNHPKDISWCGNIDPKNRPITKIKILQIEDDNVLGSIRYTEMDIWNDAVNYLKLVEKQTIQNNYVAIYEAIVTHHTYNNMLYLNLIGLQGNKTVESWSGKISVLVTAQDASWEYNGISKFKPGDKVNIRLMAIEYDMYNIWGSIKQCYENPILKFKEKYKLNDIIEDIQVKSIRTTGVKGGGTIVVEKDKVIGTISHSELGWDQVSSDALYEDFKALFEEKKSLVISKAKWVYGGHDSGSNTIQLSIKQLTKNPITICTHKYSQGSIVEGTVSQVVQEGLYVSVDKFEGIVFIKRDHLSRNLSRCKTNLFNKGDNLSFVLLHEQISRGGKNSLTGSIKLWEDKT